MLCHRIEVARISGATTTDCVFCNVIGYRRITPGKALNNQLNEDRGIGRRSPDPFSLERGRGLGTRLFQQDTSGQGYSPDPSSHGQKGLGSRLGQAEEGESGVVSNFVLVRFVS